MTGMKTKVFLCSRLPLHDTQSNSVCPPSAAIPREPRVCLSRRWAAARGGGPGGRLCRAQALPLLRGKLVGLCFRRRLLAAPLRSSEGREEAWQLGSKGALGHLGPFHPEPGHIPPPASSLRTQRCAAGACALPSCPRALAHSSLHAAGAGKERPHTALGAVPWGSGAPGSLSPAPGAGFVPQCWGCCARSFPNASEVLLVATASVPAEVEQERLQMGVIQDLHQASESCRAGDLG